MQNEGNRIRRFCYFLSLDAGIVSGAPSEGSLVSHFDAGFACGPRSAVPLVLHLDAGIASGAPSEGPLVPHFDAGFASGPRSAIPLVLHLDAGIASGVPRKALWCFISMRDSLPAPARPSLWCFI